MPTMLILRGIAGHFDGKDWPRGALYEEPALEYARARGYVGRVLDVPGTAAGAVESRPQVRATLAAIDADPSVAALYGFSGGGYNIVHILARMSAERRKRIKLVIVLGAPQAPPSLYEGGWELVYRKDPPAGHMAGPQALLNELGEDMAPTFESLRAEYAAQWARMNITLDRVAATDSLARKLLANKARYQNAERLTGVPWFVIAAWHERESSADFSTQLAQGDPLNRRSAHVPTGRGPFNTWEDGARDALVTLKGLDKIKEWPIERIAYESERYNGFGYRNHGVPSAYLWSFSDIYKGGKYVADGVWSSTATDKQVGVMPLIKRMAELDNTIKIGGAAAAPDATPTPVSAPPPVSQPDFFAAMRANGATPATTEGDLNILYVDGMNLDYTRNEGKHNTWCALRLVLGHDGRVLGKWKATVRPGDHYVEHRINPKGAASIKQPGQYRAWRVGVHRNNHEALVQVAPVTVTRDDDENFLAAGDKEYTGSEYGINQHGGYDLDTPDRASAGCLVGQSMSGQREFMALIKRDQRWIKDRKYIFYTTILPASAVLDRAPDKPAPAPASLAGWFSKLWGKA